MPSQTFQPVVDLAELELPLSPNPISQIAIAATFTAEPLGLSLAFWLQALALPAQLEFAPYGQLFQSLLEPTGLFSINRRGLNVLLVRLEDLQPGGAGVAVQLQKIQDHAQELIELMKLATQRSAVPYLLCLCPASPGLDLAQSGAIQQIEVSIAAELSEVSGVVVVTSAALAATYPVSNYYDPHTDELGHIPYTPTFFAALATMIARKS
jgi:hypothetical protein